MGRPNVNISVGSPLRGIQTIKTISLKPNVDFISQITEEDVKYVIKWNYDLGGATVTIPRNCILCFDGGMVANGTIIGNNTYIDNVCDLDSVFGANTILEGTWEEKVDSELSNTSNRPVKNKVVKEALDGKVDKIEGKGLSDVNFTQEDKNKLNGIAPGAGVNVQSDWNENDSDNPAYIKNKPIIPVIPDIPTKVSDLTNDSGFQNQSQVESIVEQAVSGKADDELATNNSKGLMSAADKTKLDAINADAEPNVQVDWNEADPNSDKFIKNKPNIPSEFVQVQSDWNQNNASSPDYIKNKPTIPTVTPQAQSDWNEADISSPAFIRNKPTIPQGSSVDSQLNENSSNPVENRVVTAALNAKANLVDVYNKQQVDAALSSKAGTNLATTENAGLMSAEDKAKLNRVPTRGFYDDVTSVTLNGTKHEPDAEGDVNLGNVVTVNQETGKIPASILPQIPAELCPSITVDQQMNPNSENAVSNKAVSQALYNKQDPLVSGANIRTINGQSILGRGNLEIGGSGQGVTVDDELNSNSTNPVQNKVITNKIVELGGNTINYEERFAYIIEQFNGVMTTINEPLILVNSDLYLYLKEYYNEAYKEFVSAHSILFDAGTYPELDNDPCGIHGDDMTYYNLAFDAMASWLVAMCLTELMPSFGNASTNNINNQTRFFMKAYEIGGGRAHPLYGGYAHHADVMIARYAAGAVYAYIRGKKTHREIDILRNKLGYSIISGTIYDDLGYVGKNGSMTTVGYFVNTNLFIPYAPGPYATGYDNNRVRPYQQSPGQPMSLFNTQANPEHDWYKDNYIKDIEIDNYIVAKYNMSSATLTKEEKTRLIFAGTIGRGSYYNYFGDKKVQYNGIVANKYSFDEAAISASIKTANIFYIVCPFAAYKDKLYGDPTQEMFNGVHTKTFDFFENIMDLADNTRNPTYHTQDGRRRPLGSADYDNKDNNGQPIPRGGGSNYFDPLNGVNMTALHAMFADRKSNADSWAILPDVALDPAKSYPSGHTAQSWIVAMFLSQITSEMNGDYSEIASLMRSAYAFGVARTVGRFHWNSDIMYGRLFATIAQPIINCMSGMLANYDIAKAAIAGGSSSVTPITTSTVNVTITNNTNSAVTIEKRGRFVISKGGLTIATRALNFDGSPLDTVTIPSKKSVTFSNVSVDQQSATLFGGTFATINSSTTVDKIEGGTTTTSSNVMLYNNQTYQDIGSNTTGQFTDGGGIVISIGQESQDQYAIPIHFNINITNNSGSTITMRGSSYQICIITYGVSPRPEDGGKPLYFRLRANLTGASLTIAAGATASYAATIPVDSSVGQGVPGIALGKPFATSSQRGTFESNIGWYASNGNCNTMNEISSNITLQEGGTYNVSIPVDTNEWSGN